MLSFHGGFIFIVNFFDQILMPILNFENSKCLLISRKVAAKIVKKDKLKTDSDKEHVTKSVQLLQSL